MYCYYMKNYEQMVSQLKSIMKDKKISQVQLRDMIDNQSLQSLRQKFSLKDNFSINDIIKISEALDIPIGDLFGESKDINSIIPFDHFKDSPEFFEALQKYPDTIKLLACELQNSDDPNDIILIIEAGLETLKRKKQK